MMPRRMQTVSSALVAWVCATTLAVTIASAQSTVPESSVPGVSAAFNTVVLRARALANNGDGAEARTLLDSLVTVSPRSSNAMAEALYWRALLSEDATAAELDWKLIVVDVPFSPRASDALLRLSELDLLRNNQQLARRHVQQLLSDNPASPLRPRALMILARSYFDDRDVPRGCGVLTVVRREAPLSAVEVRLQADELQQQCRNVAEIAMGSAPASTARIPASAPVTTATQAAPTPPVAQKAETGSLATRTAVLPTTSKVNAAAARRDSIARATSIRDSISRVVSERKADSVARAVERATERVVAQQKADSVRRDSVSRAGLLAAAAQRMAANARRDSIALDSMGRDRATRSVATAAATTSATTTAAATAAANTSAATTGATTSAATNAATGRAATNPATAARSSTAGRNTTSPPARTREILVFNADSARGDSLARDAAAIEARIMGAAGERDSLKREAARRESERRETARRAAAKAGRFSVQVAAYQNKADADALVKRLAASDMSARTVGTKKPFRVQVGRYATRAEATAALAELKRNGQKGAFVVEAGK